MPPADTKPGVALADRLREENERFRRKEDELAQVANASLEDLEDFATRLLPREVRRLERAKWEPSVRVDLDIKTDPGHPPPEPAQPCTEDDGRLPGIQYVPKPFRKYVVRAAVFGLVALIVGPDRAKELLGMVISLGAQDSKLAPQQQEEDSGSP